MSALRKNEIYETAGYEAAPLKKSAGWLPVVIVTAHGTAAYEPAAPAAVAEKHESTAKNIALFLASPFIGLAYLFAMPVVAFAALAWIGAKALAKKVPLTKTIALAVAAPFIGLAAVVAGPFVGLGVLAWVGWKRMATN
ncbi:MAG: hypothetical protein WC073_03650 [Sterolibacterium sp.]